MHVCFLKYIGRTSKNCPSCISKTLELPQTPPNWNLSKCEPNAIGTTYTLRGIATEVFSQNIAGVKGIRNGYANL